MSDTVAPAPVAEPVVASVTPVMKPGYKTTEFWLSFAATAVGFVVASGIAPSQGPYSQVVGMVIGLLGAMGYTVPRMSLKASQYVSQQ